MNNKQITFGTKFEIKRNDLERLEFEQYDYVNKIRQSAQKVILEKNRLIEDFIYQNLETSILQTMKLKIENELLKRRLLEVKP